MEWQAGPDMRIRLFTETGAEVIVSTRDLEIGRRYDLVHEEGGSMAISHGLNGIETSNLVRRLRLDNPYTPVFAYHSKQEEQ